MVKLTDIMAKLGARFGASDFCKNYRYYGKFEGHIGGASADIKAHLYLKKVSLFFVPSHTCVPRYTQDFHKAPKDRKNLSRYTQLKMTINRAFPNLPWYLVIST